MATTDLVGWVAERLGVTTTLVEATSWVLYGRTLPAEYAARGATETTTRALLAEVAAGSGARRQPVERAPRRPWDHW